MCVPYAQVLVVSIARTVCGGFLTIECGDVTCKVAAHSLAPISSSSAVISESKLNKNLLTDN